MQKIKYGVLDKLLRADLSRAEMDFILHISHYQDDTGCVSGIYYRDICEALQISYQTFYDVLRSLQAKEIIKVDKAFYGDWDVTILDNSFQNGITGYVSTGDDLFLDPEFQKCGPQEKLLALEFLKIAKNPSNGGKYRIGKEKLLEKYDETRYFKISSPAKKVLCYVDHRGDILYPPECTFCREEQRKNGYRTAQGACEPVCTAEESCNLHREGREGSVETFDTVRRTGT